ncbi:MAG TPA: TadE/TadG family type IV pilus assembly protein [Mycobacteriales bacterium]|nr:TadE/TadG family type IV pilus assembly protein [Mycobacteriales bacterium]
MSAGRGDAATGAAPRRRPATGAARRRRSVADTGDRGSAVTEYVLVATLLVLVFLGVVQVALVLHARNVLVADAAEGARTAATRGATLGDGERACAGLVGSALSGAVSPPAGPGGPCVARYLAGSAGRPPLVSMRARVTLPLTFVPLGRVQLDVSARAVQEPR